MYALTCQDKHVQRVSRSQLQRIENDKKKKRDKLFWDKIKNRGHLQKLENKNKIRANL